MNRRGFFGMLAGVALLPFVWFKNPCKDGHKNWNVGLNLCPDCGVTLKDFWIKKFGPPPQYKVTRHKASYNGHEFSFDHFEPIKS